MAENTHYTLNLTVWCAVLPRSGRHPESVQTGEHGWRRGDLHPGEEEKPSPQRSEGGEEAWLLFQYDTHHRLQRRGD